jgi:small-conductance mechanosensitive channel
MDWGWLSLHKLMDPNTGTGAAALALVVIILAWVTSIVTTHLLQRPLWAVGKLKRRVDETVVRYMLRIKNLAIFLIAALVYASLVPSLKALVAAFVAGAGVTALVLGFAAKSALANLVSGLFLAIYRPFHIGDKVTIEDEYGTVEDITLRHTVVRTWEYKRLVIPNEKIDSMTLINYSIVDPLMLCTVELGVSYDTDIDLARRLILEEANRCPHRLDKADEPWVRVISHSDFAIKLRLYVWVPDMDAAWLAKFWLLEHIKKRFDLEGVEIPFPYRTVVFKKDLSAPRRNKPEPEQPR